MNQDPTKNHMISLLSSAQGMTKLAKGASNDFVSEPTGTVFKKEIFTYGEWVNPYWWWDGELTMTLDAALAYKMKANLENNVLGSKLPVPLNHTGDVKSNTGEVIGLEVGTDRCFAYLDIRDEDTVAKIEKGLIWDVSMGFDWDYVSQKDQTAYGPTLFHVALTDEPYINNMTGFERAEFSKHTDKFAQQFAINGTPSVIMLSKSKVEEIKMLKLSTVKNDKDYAVKVTYKDDKDNDVTVEVAAGAEVNVPEAAADEVTKQIAESEAPAAEETDEEKAAREAEEAKAAEEAEAEAAKKAEEEAAAAAAAAEKPEGGETAEQKLAKANAKIAEMSAEKEYQTLLSAGKITPAQKELFLSLAKVGSVTLSADVKVDGKVTLAKGEGGVNIVTMLSAILNAGPALKLNAEQGAQGEENKVELSKEQEEKITKMGFNLATFKKQLEAGTITLNEIEEK